MPDRTPLGANVFGDLTRPDYIVSKVYFESLPGFFVAGNLYRPIGDGPFPAILSPHGHWAYGRLENSAIASVPGRAISLARQGFVVFTYDMVGYNDSPQLEHRGVRRAARKAVGTERRRPSVVERHSRARFSRVAAIRAPRSDRRDRRVRRRHAGVSARRGRRAGRRGCARQHDFAAHAGRMSLREPAGPAARYKQCGDRGDDCAAAAPDGVGDGGLDHQHARARVSRRSRVVCAERRGRSRARRAVRRASQLQPRVARGGVRMDGALAAGCAGRYAP